MLAAMTTPDAICLVVCLVMAIRGAFKGFAWQAVRTVGLVAALFGAGVWHKPFGSWLATTLTFLPGGATPWIAWILIFASLFAAATWFGWMAKGAIKRVNLGEADRMLGFALGGLMGLVLMTAAFLAWGSFVSEEKLEKTLTGSIAVEVMPKIVDAVEPLLPEDVRERWTNVLHTLHEVNDDDVEE